jgi:hypothetical protein
MRRLLGLSWFVLIVVGIVGYSLYLDNAGIVTTGRVSAKQETISIHSGDWNRHFLLQVGFQVPGELIPRYAQGYVDTLTYDRTRIGDSVPVRYLPSPILHQLVLIPTARLASISTFSFPADSYGPLERAIAVILPLALLLIFAEKANSRIARILFIILGSVAFGYFLFPRQMPPPAGSTQSARATVAHISTVTRILEGRRERGMTTSQPYDIVQLSFVPQGHTESVVAVDEIDHDSIPGLSPGEVLPIQYQSDQPRIARILGGDRTFPEKARMSFLVSTGAMFLFLLFIHWLRSMVRSKASRVLATAQTAVLKSRQRHEVAPEFPTSGTKP